jgi:hypothetical protein
MVRVYENGNICIHAAHISSACDQPIGE